MFSIYGSTRVRRPGLNPLYVGPRENGITVTIPLKSENRKRIARYNTENGTARATRHSLCPKSHNSEKPVSMTVAIL